MKGPLAPEYIEVMYLSIHDGSAGINGDDASILPTAGSFEGIFLFKIPSKDD